MRYKSKRLRQTPSRRSIGRKTRMDHPKRRTCFRIRQIFEVITNLNRTQLSFINQLLTRKRSHIKTNRVIARYACNLMRNIIAENKQFSFKIFIRFHIKRTFHKKHFHYRFNTFCQISQVYVIDWNRPITQNLESKFIRRLLNNLFTFFSDEIILRKEQHSHTIIIWFR